MDNLSTNGLAQLSEPTVAITLNRLLARMEALEARLQGLTAALGQAPAFVAMAGDIVDEGYRKATASGLDLEARASDSLYLLKRLTDPTTVTVLEQLLDLAAQAPKLLAMVGDMADDAYRSAAQAGIDIELMVKQGGVAAQRLSDLMRSPEFGALMNSGMLDPRAVALLGKAAGAMVTSRQQPIQPLGPLGLLRALGDPDLQRGLGFFVTFARAFGQAI